MSTQPFDVESGSVWVTGLDSIFNVRLLPTSFEVMDTVEIVTDLSSGIPVGSTKVRSHLLACRFPLQEASD